jgi:hypothetical protein
MTPFDACTSGVVHLRAVHEDAAAGDPDADALALERLRRLQLDDLRRRHLARDDVIEEDRLQLRLVREQCVERRLRHLREGRVRRREHGERALALQRPGEAGGLQQLRQRREGAGGRGGGDDVALLRRPGRGGRRGDGGDGEQRERDPDGLHECTTAVRRLSPVRVTVATR